MIPEDKFSFWEETQKKELYENLVRKASRGHLKDIRQPRKDIEKDGIDLDEYLESEFQQLKE